MMTTNTNAALAEDLQDMVSKALRRAWQLGQTYWQQADSEYTSQHRKADETQGKFDALVEETRTALSTAAQPPADGALNTIAAMFHSGEEIEGPDGLAMMVDMSVWNDALDAFEGIIGDEMEPAKEQA